MAFDPRGIPKKVLNGRVPEFKSVHNLYKALLIQGITRRLNISFWERAEHQRDSYGNFWKKLRKSTLEIKAQLKLHSYSLNKSLNVGLLAPSQMVEWQKVYNATYAKTKDKKQAKKAAWDAIKKVDPEREYISLINIRTGALVAATRPGIVTNNRYYPPKGQRAVVSESGISLIIDIPYADAVDQKRQIIPEDINQWAAEAHDEIIGQVKNYYVYLQSSAPRRTKKTKRSNNPRNKVK